MGPGATRWSVLLAAAALAGCVSLDEPTIAQGLVRAGQKTLLLVYPAPGPWLTTPDDPESVSSAKVIPGVADMLSIVQDTREHEAAKDLQPYFARWKPEAKLRAAFIAALKTYPGALVMPGEEGPDPETLRSFNAAPDGLQWRRRYLLSESGKVRAYRDYSKFLELDQALVLETNVQHELLYGDQENMIPALEATTRLYRAGTMKLLWTHADLVSDAGSQKRLAEFKYEPYLLVTAWDKLMPALAEKVAASLAGAMRAASAPLIPGELSGATTAQAPAPAPPPQLPPP